MPELPACWRPPLLPRAEPRRLSRAEPLPPARAEPLPPRRLLLRAEASPRLV